MSEQVPVLEQTVPQDTLIEDMDISTMDTPTTTTPTPNDAEAIKSRMEEMEREGNKLKELQTQMSQEASEKSEKEKQDIDSRSVYVGNVDYGSTPLELQQHFSSAGVVNRVTLLTNKFTGQPKGYAYVEFTTVDAVEKAVSTLDGTSFRDRDLKVSPKRTNIPGISSTNRGRGRGRGGFRGRAMMRGGFRGRGMSRGGRGGGRFAPY